MLKRCSLVYGKTNSMMKSETSRYGEILITLQGISLTRVKGWDRAGMRLLNGMEIGNEIGRKRNNRDKWMD